MSRLLVSVRSVGEAHAALAGGADILDIKEPLRGSLGRADDTVIAEIVAAISGKAPISAALGELSALPLSVPPGLDFAKVGIADPIDWRSRWVLWRAGLTAGAVLVAYADVPHRDEVIATVNDLNPSALLIDTLHKSGHTLVDYLDVARIQQLIASVSCPVALAGSLDLPTIEHLARLKPAIIAVRSAACDGGRAGLVSAQRVRAIRQVMGKPD